MSAHRIAIILVATLVPSWSTADENDIVRPELLSGMKYRMVGPYRGGRVTAVTGVPQNPHLFYSGSTGGGVWKSDNAGEHWTNITDGQFKAGGIGAIAVALSDPNVIYVGTGSACIRGNVSPGVGVYKTDNAGKTWSHVGLPNAGQIGKIQVHPTNPDLVYVAVLGNVFGPHEERGVFRSRDGGKSWDKVLYVDERTGAVDLAMNPENPRILYAAVWNGERKPWTLISGSEENGVYQSTDGGDTWNKLAGGLPQGMVGRVGVAVSPARPNRVWALVEADEGGLYRTDNGGTSWQKVSDQSGIRERPWYYMHVTAHPKDENTIYISNVLVWKSIDGGKSFTPMMTGHGDNHAMWINPDDTDIIINGDDGGAEVTLNGGRNWSTLWNQPTAEFYRVTVDNQFPYRLYGPQQDNSTISVASRTHPGMIGDTEDVFQFGGCESGHIAVDPRDPDIVYAGCFGGSITRFDRKTGQTREIIAYPQLQLGQRRDELKFRFQWNAPIRISPHDPDIIYHTSQIVHRSNNGGQSWTGISPDLTTNNPEHQDYAGGPITADGTGVEVYGTIFAFEESPHEQGVLWTGSDDGRIHISKDAGGTWSDVTPSGFPGLATVNSIDISAHNSGRVIIAAYRYRQGDMKPYIYRTDDYGETWASLADGTNGIPEDHFVRVVREDPDRAGLLYAGTEFGMFISFDDGAHWQSFQSNLPATPITDIQVHEQDLVLSTQGRAFWILDDLTPLHELTEDVTEAEAHLFTPRRSYRVFSGGGIPGLGAGRRGQNPPDGVVFHYALKETPETPVTLEIVDASGETVQTFSSERRQAGPMGPLAALAAMFGINFGPKPLPATPGVNRYVWDLRHPAPKTPRGAVIFGLIRGPIASPGTYQAKMTMGDWSQTTEFQLLADPRGSTTQAEFDEQLAFLKDVGAQIESVSQNLDNLRSARDQVKAAVTRAKEAGIDETVAAEVQESADAIVSGLTGIEDELVQTKSRGFEDPLNYPGRLYAQLAHLQSVVNGGFGAVDAPPTDGAKQRLVDLKTELDDILARLRQILTADVVAFSEKVDALNIPTVLVKESSP